VRVEHPGSDVVGRVHFPPAALHADDVHPCGRHGVFESQPALLAVEGGRNAFDDGHFVARSKMLRERVADLAGAGTIVRAYERHGMPGLFEDIGVQLVVDVHDEDARLRRPPEDRHERFRVRRRNHDRIDLLRDHLLDEVHLLGQIRFVPDAVHDQLVVGGVRRLMPPGSFRHRAEELVRQRLHDECDLRLSRRRFVAAFVGRLAAGTVQQGHRTQGYGKRQARGCARGRMILHARG
jgi:hypothetical protein